MQYATAAVATPKTDAALRKEYNDKGRIAAKNYEPRKAPVQDQSCMLASWWFEGYDEEDFTPKILRNGYQGNYKKVLTVCSAGLLRAPTAALVLSQEPFNFNTRPCGSDTNYNHLIPLSIPLIQWADEIVFMESRHFDFANKFCQDRLGTLGLTKTYHVLDIPDLYEYRNPELMKLIEERYCEVSGFQI